jgi:hypothetical protein
MIRPAIQPAPAATEVSPETTTQEGKKEKNTCPPGLGSQRYVHYVAEHAKDAVRQAQGFELTQLKPAKIGNVLRLSHQSKLAKKHDNW